MHLLELWLTAILLTQMAISKRSLTLGRDFVGEGASAPSNRQRHSPVAQWRVEHGLPEAPDADHTCSGRCSFVNIVDNVYICEHCGREHVCDDSCRERVLDTANGLPVCPISGMCFDQLDAAWEVSTFQSILLACLSAFYQMLLFLVNVDQPELGKTKAWVHQCCLQGESDGGKPDDMLEWGEEGFSLSGLSPTRLRTLQ